jgi:hypothetical protein
VQLGGNRQNQTHLFEVHATHLVVVVVAARHGIVEHSFPTTFGFFFFLLSGFPQETHYCVLFFGFSFALF